MVQREEEEAAAVVVLVVVSSGWNCIDLASLESSGKANYACTLPIDS